MSTIELVDPELRDALALWPLLPLTAESLTQRRANALDLVTELRFDVTNGRKPTQSQTFNKTLQAAPEKRVAFTSFVSG